MMTENEKLYKIWKHSKAYSPRIIDYVRWLELKKYQWKQFVGMNEKFDLTFSKFME